MQFNCDDARAPSAATMQGIHQQQQQLAKLLSSALPQSDSSHISSTDKEDESFRIAAVNSLHETILYSSNSFLVTHSAQFLAQGFSQLLSDKYPAVQKSAAKAFGALCSVVTSISFASNGSQNDVVPGEFVDQFFSWALPLVSYVSAGDNKTTELALEGLSEFLNVGDPGEIETYASSILKACQELLEDERTSCNLVRQLLGILTLLSQKFSSCFQPHFVDIVDLLLGWALVPNLAESDRCLIVDSFMQFKIHWVGNISFSFRLMLKFLDDIDVLLQDRSSGTTQQFQRLMALLSCFLTVLQSVAFGLLEMNALEQINEPLSQMVPQLLHCLSMIGNKFGWSKWLGDSWRCFILLAETLGEGFCSFYSLTVDILFQSLVMDDTSQPVLLGKINSFQVHEVLKTNLRLLSLQKLGLLPSSVQKILQFDMPISQLRLHPNHLVTVSSAATYIFLLQHENNEVVEHAVNSLFEEIKLLMGMLEKNDSLCYSKYELFALVKFDLVALLSCVSPSECNRLICEPDIAALYLKRSGNLVAFIVDKLNPFDLPIPGCVELQVTLVKTLGQLSAVEFLSKCSLRKHSNQRHVNIASKELLSEKKFRDGNLYMVIDHLRKFSIFLIKSLGMTSPIPLKVEALKWIQSFCQDMISLYETSDEIMNQCSSSSCGHISVVGNLIYSVLDVSYDRDPKLRVHVATSLELLLKARLVHPYLFYLITKLTLDKLGDPDMEIKNAFVKLLSIVLPITMHQHGLHDSGALTAGKNGFSFSSNRSYLYWKQVFALKQLPQQLQSQQLVSILNYISQRSKTPLSSWIHRLIQRCRSSKDSVLNEMVETGNCCANGSWLTVNPEDDILYKISSVNNLAGAWWAIHEATRYCIFTRLRTNLGGPSQTFAALERMLLDVALWIQLETDPRGDNLNIVCSSGARLLPMRLLLDFVESMKKSTFNAYDGSTVLPPANQQSSLFFLANKKVCKEWFSRICEPMLNAGLALQCHDAVIHYCALRLQELKVLMASALKDKSQTQGSENLHNISVKFSEDILSVSRNMALAFCKSHDPESLIGLQGWIARTFSSLFVDEENKSVGHKWVPVTFSWITGLIYQARGQYEKAAAHFTHLLQSDELLSSMGSDSVHFIIARIIECYTAVSDWNSLEVWLLELQTLRTRHAGKKYSGALTAAGFEVNAIQAWAKFDDREFQAAWACLDLTPKTYSELTLDPKLALQRSELMLLRAMLFQSEGKVEKIPHEIQKARSMLEETLSVLPLDGLTEAAAYATQLHCIFAFEDGYKFRFSGNEQKQHHLILSSYIQVLPSIVDKIHQDCGLWLKVRRVYENIVPNSLVCVQLSMNLLILARKQGNLGLANRLNDYLRDRVSNLSEGSIRNFLLSSLQYEGILLMHAENKFEAAISNLCSYLCPCIVSLANIAADSDDTLLKTKACLKLSKWLKHKHFSTTSLENIALKMLSDFMLSDDSSHTRDGMSISPENTLANHNPQMIINEIVGTVTKLSTRLCPTMGKSWISYASWCYREARDSLSSSHDNILCSSISSSILVPEILPDRCKLTGDEALKVESVILHIFQKHKEAVDIKVDREGHSFCIGCSENLRNESALKATVEQVMDIIEASAGASGGQNSIGESLFTTLNSQLQTFLCAIFGLNGKELSSSLDDLMDVWRSLRKRRVSLFGHAAHGFIQYLSYSSYDIWDGKLVDLDCKPLNQKSGSYTLRATLYVLHILLNYGAELKDTIEPGLSTIPLLSWQEITPQLFARLTSHPEHGVRKQLEGILIMLAKLSPSSIVFPTLVDVNACDANPFEELQHILGCLIKLYPRLIEDVQLMINELENLTVLWEELWLSTLQDLHTDVTRRINVLKDEAARVAENATLSHTEKTRINTAKYSALMAPIVVALERRLASTSRKPETCHEIWFNKEYIEHLKSAILSFKTPPASIAELGDVWKPFDNIASSIACYQKKSSISLEEVAPKLSLLSSSDVPMPGLEKQFSISESDGDLQYNSLGNVKIASFSEQVSILSTKTRPKKLVILGSDGEKYAFLLKGREDLRLDARIMQLLQAINGFIHSSPQTRSQFLSIRYYSVTPISGRAGLIQWVDNVISVYSVFKSWQTRSQIAQLSASGAENLKSTNYPPIPRPNDMFYGKIIPALKERGIWKVISRKDWPHEVKKKVLLELMKEAPRQLLHQELWCASEGFKAFSSKVKRYSGSVAAMSIVGHILGLGDRHLDNILLDFSSGDIVHIDYNVCFDKGQRLKIPEIVPFRLTQTIEAALGFSGIEGTFRANCEKIVDLLRQNKDIILMILDVFLWDPLVEWTRGDSHDDATIGGEERKGMELAVSLSLFASRVQEIRVPLLGHHDLLLATLPSVASALEKFVDVLNQFELVSPIFFHVDEERSSLILRESSVRSIASEATSNLENVCATYEIQAREFAQTKAMVAEMAQEATTWMEQHVKVLDALRNNLIPVFKPFTKMSNMADSLSLTSAVSMAGVPLTIVPEPTLMQCHGLDREVSQLINDLDQGVSYALDALEEYSIYLQRLLPLNYPTTTLVNSWAQVLQLSVNTISPDILSIAKTQAAELIANACDNDHGSIMRNHNDLCLKAERYAMEREKIELECAELMNSIDLDTESNAKKCVVSDLVKYMQFYGFARKGGGGASSMHLRLSKSDRPMDVNFLVGMKENKEKAYSVFHLAIASMYCELKNRSFDILNNSSKQKSAQSSLKCDFGTMFSDFEEQVEKCIVIDDVFNELSQIFCRDSTNAGDSESNWLSNIKRSLLSCKSLVEQLNEIVLPDIVRSAVSFKSEVMDAFDCLSQIRGSIDTTLERYIDVELERASLLELERNYVIKVGLITEQRLALEEASVKGRDHLSWEEAEELASQEEACRAELDQLHVSWNQKDLRANSLVNTEAGIKNALISAEHHLESFINVEQESETPVCKRNILLSTLIKPFSELESIDEALSSVCYSSSPHAFGNSNLIDLLTSRYPVSGFICKFSTLLNNHCFFMWKVGVLDLFINSCIQDVASFVDQKVGFDHLLNVVKNKIEIILQQQIDLYLKERIGPAFLAWLEQNCELVKQSAVTTEKITPEQESNDNVEVKKVTQLLEEYCNVHETARAARSVASAMKNQMKELGEALFKTSLEIVQMEWIYDVTLNPSLSNRILFHKFLSCDDDLYPIILNLSRHNILEVIKSAVSKIAKSVESLQACEGKTGIAEEQLQRAMGWACGGSNLNATGNQANKNSETPPEFHEHLLRRREILWGAQENASDIIKFCMTLLEFEASRDGVFRMPAVNYQVRNSGDGRVWQQACLDALTRLDVTYHSFTRIEKEWKLAQSSMEAASSDYFSATNELSLVSMKAKSASDDLQSTLIVMRDCAYELNVALSAFSHGTKVHKALTTECGSMLEEVLSITEDLHDIHNLGKEAATAHHILVEDLSKASSVLLPLESMLSKDINAMTTEKESKMEISPKYGQAIYDSYSLRIREAFLVFTPLVSSLTFSVEGLLSMVTNLARTASFYAGNLHKALEGLGESQEASSQGISFLSSHLAGDDYIDNKHEFHKSDDRNLEDLPTFTAPPSQDIGSLSPPVTIYSSSDSRSSDAIEHISQEPNVTVMPSMVNWSSQPYSGTRSQENLYCGQLESNLPEANISDPNSFTSSINEPLGSSTSWNNFATVGVESTHSLERENIGINLRFKDEASTSNVVGIEDRNEVTHVPTMSMGRRIGQGKNAYAMSVLRRVELKLDGCEIDKREFSIAEQVDYLLKQAMSIDNLCNMYEGWTPWI